ncbi:hypothetical protein IV203_021965 [Nitzschia inconspicua]|uniref:Uncharacterized protein n=1 Tax=Nitzschia inconspicua TaxID=303405 RepID=A0A9K3KHY3_9STRA|nr:hypothetical protein IV203_021965 [Nitzschia inconspicua]
MPRLVGRSSGTAPPATAIAQSAAAPPPAPTAHAHTADLGNTLALASNAQFVPAPAANDPSPPLMDAAPSPVVPADNPYTAEQLVVIESIAEEASSMFCVGATFNSHEEL